MCDDQTPPDVPVPPEMRWAVLWEATMYDPYRDPDTGLGPGAWSIHIAIALSGELDKSRTPRAVLTARYSHPAAGTWAPSWRLLAGRRQGYVSAYFLPTLAAATDWCNRLNAAEETEPDE